MENKMNFTHKHTPNSTGDFSVFQLMKTYSVKSGTHIGLYFTARNWPISAACKDVRLLLNVIKLDDYRSLNLSSAIFKPLERIF